MIAKGYGIIFYAGCLPESDLTYMSYILDALKKIEHEKSKKLSDGRVSIAGDLFQEPKQVSGGTGLRKIAALVVVVSLLAGGGTWFVLQGKNSKKTVSAPPQVAPQVAPPAAPPPPVVPAPPVVIPPAPTPVQTATPAVAPPVATKPAATAPQDDSAANEDNDASPPTTRSSRARRSVTPAIPQPVNQKQPVQTVPAPADIKLSGIAWQDERSGRRAVINGFLLKEGAVVSGATIIDIQTNIVRFSTAGGQFEIRLDAVLPVENKK
jgi:general secretion pathway protein B